MSVVNRYLFNPIKGYITAINRIFGYLACTRDMALIFGGDMAPVADYSDADYAGDRPGIHRLTSGYSFSVGSGLIS